LSFQEDAIGIRLRDVIGPDKMIRDNMMWGSDYPHSESTFPQSRKILAEILARISQRGGCIGTLDLRKSFCESGLSQGTGGARCRRSVARIYLALHAWKGARWWPGSTAAG
jgi:hypothetical protein